MSQFYEDLEVGSEALFGSFTFTEDAIIRYASVYDPQPFHLDHAAAKSSHFGALCASGWHTASVWMKLYIQHEQKLEMLARQRGEAVAQLGPGLGFKNLKWSKPVYAGDRLSYGSTIVAKRVSETRPRWGVVTSDNWAINQDGVTVFTMTASALRERRP